MAGKKMDFRLAPMTFADAQAVAHWHYEGLYAVSDWENDPDMLGDFLRWPDLYYSVRDAGNDLVGFAQFVRLQRDTNTLSAIWGLHPDLIGNGHGMAFVESCLTHGQTRYKPLRFTLGVWAFNQRGRRVYEQVGFKVMRVFNSETRFGVLEFMEMMREQTSPKPNETAFKTEKM